MKSKVFIFGALVVVAASACADLKSDWQKTLDNYCKLANKKDLKGAEKIVRATFAKDFQFVGKTGQKINLEQWIAQGNAEAKMMKDSNLNIHIDSVKEGKTSADMGTTIKMSGTAQMDPKGKPGKFVYNGKSVTTVVKKDGKWLISKIVEKTGTMTFNGKPLKM